MPQLQDLLDRGGGQEQRADQVGIRAGLAGDVIRGRLGERGEPGREDGSVVEQRLEQGALGLALSPDTDGVLER